MSAVEPGAGYLTRGRAAAIERQLVAMQARFDAQLDELRRQLADVEARQLDLPRALATATLEVVRRNGTGTPAAVPARRKGAG